MQRFCFALDLKPDQELISEYENWHKRENNWPGINAHIIESGIIHMQIFRTGNRLFMIMDTTDDFVLEKQHEKDAASELVKQWEQLMWKFQQPLPWAAKNEKWVLMSTVFELHRDELAGNNDG